MNVLFDRMAAALRADRGGDFHIYPASRHTVEDFGLAVVRRGADKLLALAASVPEALPTDLSGTDTGRDGLCCRLAPLNHPNAVAVRRLLPWTAPISLRDRRTTIGCGDRLGRATPGHLRAIAAYPVSPLLAQQSIRELSLTDRTFEDVVDDVTFLVLQEGYAEGYGADGDHLKTLADIRTAVSAGMTMITLDLTERMNAPAENWSDQRVEEGFRKLPSDSRERVLRTYAGRSFDVAGEAITISTIEAKRCAVMYMAAMDFSRDAFDLLTELRGTAFDLEISIDETEAPTLPAHHLFIIRELLHRDITVSSLAPRFIGEFQKAIDYIGDLAEFERQFGVHCAIAKAYGDYKISIHSGSDKFSAYPIIGRYTGHRVHVKTAGTSWLEALRAIAANHPALYRRMHRKAFEVLQDALKLYHIPPDLHNIPPLAELRDQELPGLLDQKDARQVLHITYGGLLGDDALKEDFFAALDAAENAYYTGLNAHFRKHLDALGLEASA